MDAKASRRPSIVTLVPAVMLLASLAAACTRPEEPPARSTPPEITDPKERMATIGRELTPAEAVPARDGLAAVVLVDVSRSLWTGIIDSRSPLTISSEIVIAKRAVVNLVRQFDRHAQAHPEELLLTGLFAFGGESGPGLREVIPLSPPDPARTEQAFPDLANEDGESVGHAVIAGKRLLDRAGLTRRHLFVVTDGNSTYGHDPVEVMTVLKQRPEAERPTVYFIAFNLESPRYEALRKEGAQVIDATSAGELSARLEQLLTGKVLVERPQ